MFDPGRSKPRNTWRRSRLRISGTKKNRPPAWVRNDLGEALSSRTSAVHGGGGIGHIFIAEPHVHRQLWTRPPLIVDVDVKFAFTKVTIGVRLTRFGPLEEGRDALQEIAKARESVEAAPPSLLLEVALDAVQGSAKSEGVFFVRPDEVIR